ncbi:hypothetical protein B5V88_04240 [Heyndrickxia sporothermodurans]|nr:hypothetical protein B5V88_04240 [Heyndrickxia sporothermodurans]
MDLGLHSLALTTKMDFGFGSWASFARFVDQDGSKFWILGSIRSLCLPRWTLDLVLGLHSLALSTKMDLSFGSWASFARFNDQDGS